VARDSAVERRVTVRDAVQNLREFCGGGGDGEEALLVVRVRTPEGLPVTDAAWEVRRTRAPSRDYTEEVAHARHPSPDGTLLGCLRLKRGDAVRIAVWREGQPIIIREQVLTGGAAAVGIVLPTP